MSALPVTVAHVFASQASTSKTDQMMYTVNVLALVTACLLFGPHCLKALSKRSHVITTDIQAVLVGTDSNENSLLNQLSLCLAASRTMPNIVGLS